MQLNIPCFVLVSVMTVCGGSSQLQSNSLHSGKLSKLLRLRRSTVPINDLALELFRRGNTNGDDSLTQGEIASFYREFVDFPESLANFIAEGFMEHGDQNNDGLLNFFGIYVRSTAKVIYGQKS